MDFQHIQTGKFSFLGVPVQRLRNQSREVPNHKGVYFIYAIKDGKRELVYFGKAGGATKKGDAVIQNLFGRINNRVSRRVLGEKGNWSRENFLTYMIEKERLDYVDIEWFTTDANPLQIEQALYRHFGMVLPRWNAVLGRPRSTNRRF